MVAVEVGRKQTRKVCNNVRGVTRLGCILSPPLYIKTHYAQHFDFQVFLGVVVVLVCFHINIYAGRVATTPVS